MFFPLRSNAISSLLVLLSGMPLFAADRPNIVAIVTDDQARWAVGAYGNSEIKTPQMDRIAREGALFRNATTATPVCSPSRATYFSGRWPSEVKIHDWIAPDEAAAGVGLSEMTWPALLQQGGYKTAMIGKWHLGDRPQFHPHQKGFDHFFGFLGGGNKPMNPTLEVEGKEQQLTGPLPDLLTDSAIDFVRKNQAGPFLVCLHFRAPHLPYLPVPDEDSAHYKDLDPSIPDLADSNPKVLKQWQRDYYSSISSVDRNIGRVLATLDELKLTDNTLVLFTSDHGYNNGRHGVDTKGNGQWWRGGVRGPKRPNMWETSITVPLLIRWPGVVKPGDVVEEPVQNLDMFRTMLGVAGVTLPAGLIVHGRDYSPRLRGRPLEPVPAVFGMYDLHNGGLAYMRMIRTDRFKLIRHFRARGMDELYDLQKDPDEEKNVISAKGQAEVLKKLQADLTAWQQSIDDPVLSDAY